MASLDPKRYGAVDDHRVRRAQERGVLFPRLRAAPPRRGARGLPAAAHRPLLRPGEGARRPVRPGQRLGAPELLRAAGLRRPRRAQLPPRRLVALRRRGGEGDPRERRHDRRHRLRQARRQGPRRHRLPRLVHHQPAAEGRPPVADLRADRRRHHRAPNTPSSAWPSTNTTSSPPAPGPPTTPTSCASRAEDRMADFGQIEIQDVTTQIGVFALAGPRLARPAGAAAPRRRPRRRARQQALPLALRPRASSS